MREKDREYSRNRRLTDEAYRVRERIRKRNVILSEAAALRRKERAKSYAEAAWLRRKNDPAYIERCRERDRVRSSERYVTPEKRREYQNRANAKRRSTPEGRINGRVSARVWQCLKQKGAAKQRRGWEALVGYTVADLRGHLERQFARGMTWENMGEWHIDHIRPLSSFAFDAPDSPGFRAAWSLANLRPLWAVENVKKHAKITLLI